MLTRAVQILDEQAAEVRARIRQDWANGLEPYETTLTQNLVSALRRELALAGAAVYATEIPRDDEAKLYGADIALWVLAPVGGLAGVHLQAKRQYPDDTYRGLDHANSHGQQYDLLVQGARAAGALAGYAFYNGLDDPGPARVMCSQKITSADSHGVSVARASSMASHVAATVRRVDVEHLCAPLRCLLGCPARGGLFQHGLAGALLSFQGGDPGAGLVQQDDAPGYLLPLLARAVAGADGDDRLRQAPQAADDAQDRVLAPLPDAAAGRPAPPPAGPGGAESDDGGPTATVLLAVPPPGG